MDDHQRRISQQQPHVGGETMLHNDKKNPMIDIPFSRKHKKCSCVVCLHVLHISHDKLPSRECAEVVQATLGPPPLWVKAAELESFLLFPLRYSHSLVLAHNISSMYFQSGETQPMERVISGSLDHQVYI